MRCELTKIHNQIIAQPTNFMYLQCKMDKEKFRSARKIPPNAKLALNHAHIMSTDEDPGLRIESFAVINLRGVSTNKILYALSPCMQTYKEHISN